MNTGVLVWTQRVDGPRPCTILRGAQAGCDFNKKNLYFVFVCIPGTEFLKCFSKYGEQFLKVSFVIYVNETGFGKALGGPRGEAGC